MLDLDLLESHVIVSINPRLCGDTPSVESSDRGKGKKESSDSGKGKKERRSKRVKQAMVSNCCFIRDIYLFVCVCVMFVCLCSVYL